MDTNLLRNINMDIKQCLKKLLYNLDNLNKLDTKDIRGLKTIVKNTMGYKRYTGIIIVK